MSLLVVITVYRSADLTIDCLHSLKNEITRIPGAKVGICDNGNDDDTAKRLEKEIQANDWQNWAYVKSIYPNRGFTGGNNAILSDAMTWENRPDYFILLNTDTLVRSNALVELVKAAKLHPDVGIIGSRMESMDGTPQVSCFRFISPISEFLRAAKTRPVTTLFSKWEVPMHTIPETPINPQWVTFACALIRAKVLEEVGLLDKGYFLYFDDVDYCRSTLLAGWRILYWPSSKVAHLKGQSNPVKKLTSARKRLPKYYYEARNYYFKKFYSRSGLILANIFWTLGRCISLLREIIGNKMPHLAEKQWKDIWINCFKHVEPRESGIHNSRSVG